MSIAAAFSTAVRCPRSSGRRVKGGAGAGLRWAAKGKKQKLLPSLYNCRLYFSPGPELGLSLSTSIRQQSILFTL